MLRRCGAVGKRDRITIVGIWLLARDVPRLARNVTMPRRESWKAALKSGLSFGNPNKRGLPRDWGCGSKRVLSGSLISERRQRGLDREAGKHRGRGRRTQHGGHADRPT